VNDKSERAASLRNAVNMNKGRKIRVVSMDESSLNSLSISKQTI